MMRGTFANVRLRNQLAPGTEGGWTTYQPDGDVMTIYDAAMKYKDVAVPLLVLAGKEYGSGSSRDWAAKGTLLLGVSAVIAESFERIHRSNLVNMGVLPLQFQPGATASSLGLTGRERYRDHGIAQSLRPGGSITVRAFGDGDKTTEFQAIARIDTPEELVAFRHGGILPYVLRQLVGRSNRERRASRGASPAASPETPAPTRRARRDADDIVDIKAKARELGFDACGIAPAANHPELSFYREWLDRGYAGDMAYLHRPPIAAPMSVTSSRRRAR